MADFTFNIALGRVAYYAGLVSGAHGAATGQLAARVLKSVGSNTDAALRDVDTLAQLKGLSGVAEADFTNYAERVLQNVAVLVNDTDSAGTGSLAGVDANSVAVDSDDWSYANAGGAMNNTTAKMVIVYKPTSGAAETAIIPLVSFDYVETTTGSTLNILVPTGGFWSAADAV